MFGLFKKFDTRNLANRGDAIAQCLLGISYAQGDGVPQAACELTFLEGKDDVYGKDIDLANRLLQWAGPQEIVMNEDFVKQIRDEYSRMSDKES
jgi:hypothetical protein